MRDLGPDPCQQKPAFGSVPAFAAKGGGGGAGGSAPAFKGPGSCGC